MSFGMMHIDDARATRSRRPRPRGYTLLESLMAASILLGIIVAITSAVTAGQQHALEAQTRIAGSLAAEDMLSRLIIVDYADLPTWNGHTESIGAMVDMHGQPLPDVYDRIGRTVSITSELFALDDLGVTVRGRMIRVQTFDANGTTLSDISHFVPEPAVDAGASRDSFSTAVEERYA